MTNNRSLFSAAFLTLLLSASLWGQGLTGQISGVVRDPSGSVIAGARVELANAATGQSRDLTTDDSGEFLFPQLLPGVYKLTVTASGFKRYDENEIVLSASERNVLRPITLTLGAVTETVSVTAEAAKLQTQSAERAGTLTSTQILQTPIKGRHFLSLVSLMPGVIVTDNLEAPSGKGLTLRVNGSRAGSVSVTLDGIPNVDTGDQLGPITLPSLESIGEVKVLLSNYQAEYGRNNGGSISTVTKSGSKEFHGGAYYFKRNEFFNANNFFNNRDGLRRDRYRYDFPGYYIGGPVIIPGLIRSREKLFFFWAHEYLPRTTPIPLARATFPTVLERAGDFSKTLDTNNRVIAVQDPLNNRLQFPGNVIPANRIDPIGQKLLSVFPLPNTVDPSNTFNTVFQANVKQPHEFEVLRVDWNVSSKTTFYARGSHNTNKNIYDKWFQGFPVNNTFPLLTGTSFTPAFGAVATLIHTFTPTLINEASFGVSRFTQNLFVDADSAAKTNRATLGINFPQFYPQNNIFNVLPNARFGGVQSAPSIAWESRFPFFGTNHQWNWSDNLSKIYGSHNFKVGVYLEKSSRNAVAAVPTSRFMGDVDFGRNTNNPLDTNYAFSNAILGSINQYIESDSRPHMHARYTNLEWFIQDNWRVSKRLTLDLGVRFYHLVPTSSEGNKLAEFVPSDFDASKAPQLIQPYKPTTASVRQGRNPVTGEIVPEVLIGTLAPGSGQFYQGMQIFQDSIMSSAAVIATPRIGFAWDVFGNGKMAVRGGFGIFPGRITDDRTADHIGQPPLFRNITLFNTTIKDLVSAPVSYSPNNVLGVQNHYDPPTTYNMSFGVQKDIGFATVLDVAYVGSLARHLQQQRSLNAVPYGANFLASSNDPTVNRVLPLNFLRPTRSYADITYNEFASNSSYHSLQTQVNRRFRRNLLYGASWTWSKAMDLVDGNNTLNPFIDPRVRHYGKAGYDRTHTVVVNFDYNLPNFSKNWSNAFSRQAFDGWEISGVISLLSGEPLGFTYSLVSGADITGAGGAGVDSRVILLQSAVLPKGDRTPLRAFRTESVAAPSFANFGIGNAPKDAFRGPGINNSDLSLLKNFKLGAESRLLQFRFETYNSFNHTQFATLDNVARFDAAGAQVNTRFGQYLTARDGRRVQFGVKFNF